MPVTTVERSVLDVLAATHRRDFLRVHHSKPVKKWMAEHTDQIEAFYLPSYSPELNPDALLNADLKQRMTKAAPPRTKTALTRIAIGALRSIQK